MPRGGFGMRGMGMMRRRGFPLVGPMMGGGMGSPLLTALLSGGLGYVMGSGAGQRQQQQQQQQQQQPPASAPNPTATPDAPTQAGPSAPATESDKLAQLKLLDELHKSGVLTDAEFEVEKQKVLRG